MRVGEVWKLKDTVTAPSPYQINVNYDDEYQHYDLLPAIKIVQISPNVMKEEICWEGEYIIRYHMVTGLNRNEPKILGDGNAIMCSDCLITNYDCVYEKVGV